MSRRFAQHIAPPAPRFAVFFLSRSFRRMSRHVKPVDEGHCPLVHCPQAMAWSALWQGKFSSAEPGK
jgi:hypothetical protein